MEFAACGDDVIDDEDDFDDNFDVVCSCYDRFDYADC